MLLRRVIEHVRIRNALLLLWALSGAALAAICPANAEPVSSDALPQEILDVCDARAMPFGGYEPAIAAAAADLIAMGVFTSEEFSNVKIGFCGLRDAQGPAATASCARDSILLDIGYAAKDQNLVRNATLAHEMKHYLQHSERKAEFGQDYCSSDQYAADKTWMEEEADAFGDDVAALFFTGRMVEIKNECPVAASVYLEADRPMPAIGDSASFIEVAPHATVVLDGRATSNLFRIYAETTPSHGQKRIWGGAGASDTRVIDGKVYGLKRITLSSASRSAGPFEMRLSCQPDEAAPETRE